jgi:hypothetical protein
MVALTSRPLLAGTKNDLPVPLWDAGTASGWQIADPNRVKVGKDATGISILKVANNPETLKDQVGANYNLPLDAVRGCRLAVTVEARATNISQPGHTYNGIKAMMHVVCPSTADTWNQANGNEVTFPFSYDWKTLSFQTVVPRDATMATIILGLQECTGQAEFRNLHVGIVSRMAIPPAVPPKGPMFTGHGDGSLRGVMISPKIQPGDIETLAQWHVNLVRWQLMWNGFPHSPADDADKATYDKWLDGCLAHLDEMLPYFKKAGITVLIDLHSPPGGRDAAKTCRIFNDAQWQQHFMAVWDKIAKKYAGDQRIWGYDLVNEPVLSGENTGLLNWHDLAEVTSKRIRKVDSNHAIIIEPDPWGAVTGLAYFEPINVPGIVYSVHMYEPGQFTHQGVLDGYSAGPTYPGVIDGKLWNKDQIRKTFQAVKDYAKAYNVQVYVGEFSAVRWAPGADKYISDVIDVMDENNWDWSYHAFREWHGWSPEVGEDKAVQTPSPSPTARLLVLQSAFAKNKPSSIQPVRPK